MTPKQERELDRLYAAWTEDREAAAPTPLREWAARHPEASGELARWAVDEAVYECGAGRAADPAGEARALAIGRRVVAEARARYAAAPETPLSSLLDAARARGLNAKTLAARLNVGVPIVAKLNQRLLAAASIPDVLVARLAEALETGAANVRAYLDRPATLSAGASYKAEGVPQTAAPEDFAGAVRLCADMTQEQKAFWLDPSAD